MNTPQRHPHLGSEPLVYLLDPDPSVLAALTQLLSEAGIKASPCTHAAAFFARYEPERIGCLVLDMALGDVDGLAIQQEILAHGWTLPVVFLAGRADVLASVRAMKAGALDVLTKPADALTLLTAIRTGLAADLVRRVDAAEERALMDRFDRLTPREAELVPYLISGMLNKQIAGSVGVVEKTVKVHRAHVMRKLGTRNLPELVRFASRLRIEPAACGRPQGQQAA